MRRARHGGGESLDGGEGLDQAGDAGAAESDVDIVGLGAPYSGMPDAHVGASAE